MFLYALNHLTGYDAWTMEELKGYAGAKLSGVTTLAHGHPEIECPGVEVTTGPLGQGIANAVGLAIGSKNLGASFNEPGFDVVNSRVYCMTGDGCLMEGVALEGSFLALVTHKKSDCMSSAISLAGHLQLDNLILIYDNNGITCDGPLSWINTEDTNGKMRSCGWHVLDVIDGSHDVQAICAALQHAKASRGKPVFLNVRTVIGVGTNTAGTAKAHHGAFDIDSVSRSKNLAGADPSATHYVPERGLQLFRECKSRGENLEKQWVEVLKKYAHVHPERARQFASRRRGTFSGQNDFFDKMDSNSFRGMPTRESNGIILERLWQTCPLIGGGADLVNSNKFVYSETDVFHPSVSYRGRYIRYGIREHAMASISNGLAAFNPGTFLPVTATFLMFYIYVRIFCSSLSPSGATKADSILNIGRTWCPYGSPQPPPNGPYSHT